VFDGEEVCLFGSVWLQRHGEPCRYKRRELGAVWPMCLYLNLNFELKLAPWGLSCRMRIWHLSERRERG
jgi:hypothetical protein